VTGQQRRTDIDWLRAGAVYLLLAFHSAQPFSSQEWHVKDEQRPLAADLFTGAIAQWHMPLLFALAGWSIVPSIESRGADGLLRERRERLLVPLAFGVVTLMPLCAYVEERHKGEFDGTFPEYLPQFFSSLDHFTWMHLWFLAYLFVFTALYLPGMKRVHARGWRVERVPAWALYAAILPLAAVQVGLRGRWPGYQNLYDDWANFSYYSLFFIGGFLLTCFPAVERMVHAERRRAAAVGGGALAAMAAIVIAGGMPDTGSPSWVALQALSAAAGLGLVAAALGYGHELLSARERGLAFARESAMPVYVLHQPVIILLAVPVVGLGAGVPAKFALLVGASTAGTLAAYHLMRRSPRLMRLLGSKPAGPSRSGAASRSSRRARRTRGRLLRAMTRS
jgi:glucans biosynthesis protein C